MATQDGLTGLANRRHFDEKLQQEWRRAERDGTSGVSAHGGCRSISRNSTTSMVTRSGDVLPEDRRQGRLPAEARRPGDMAARYGGEEFVLLAPEYGRGGLRDRCRRGFARPWQTLAIFPTP